MLCDLNCSNLKCIASGSCVGNVPVVEAPQGYIRMSEAMRCRCPFGKTIANQFWCCNGTGYEKRVESPTVASPSVVPDANPLPLAVQRRAQLERTVAPRTIIGLTGLAGSGKSTAAMHLVERHGFQRVRFAGPLKAMLAALGCAPAEIDGDRKEVPCDLLGGKTPRWAMQTLGTEWGRNLIASDLWIRAWQHAVAQVPAGVPIVVDDCRFPNEAAAITAAGGTLVRITRPGAGAGAAGHSSEGQQLDVVKTIANDMAVGQLLDRISSLACDLSWIDHAAA